MNTIPTTFKYPRVPYTVVGGQRLNTAHPLHKDISVVLLNRGGRFYRSDLFNELESQGFGEIISLEGPQESYDVEALARKFDHVRFLLFSGQANRGEQVNTGIEEARGRFVLVLWNDMKLLPLSMSGRLLEHMEREGILCTVPLMYNSRSETIPSIMAPAFFKNRLKVIPLPPGKERTPTLFPFDYCGLYSKRKFMLSEGFDPGLRNSYWQKMDFGFRSHMWGESIEYSGFLKVQYTGDLIQEDTTPDEWYKLFFLKNLSIQFTGDTGKLPATRFISYFLRSGSGFFHSLKEFRAAQEWVRINQYRFKQDAQSVTELWEISES